MAGTQSMASRAANIAAKMRAAGLQVPQGLSASGLYRHWQRLDVNVRTQAAAARAAVEPSYRRTAAAVARSAARRAPRLVPTAGGAVVTSRDARFLRQQLRVAAARDQRVVIRATFQNDAGQWRTRDIAAGPRVDAVLTAGGTGGGAGISSGDLSGKVRIITGRRDGIPAQDILDLIAAYNGDIWAALYDLWDSEY